MTPPAVTHDPAAPATRWVLLRGLTREAGHWGDFPAQLQTALPGSRVHCVDLPGNGRLHRLPSPRTVAEMGASVRAQLQAAGLPPPYHLLAMSMGAMVAVDWAARHPAELGAAVLINTSLRPFNPGWQRLRPSALPVLLALALPGRSELAREAQVLRLTARLARPQPLLDTWADLRQRQPVSAANALRQLVAAARFRAGAKAPAVPMLVLCSRADALVHPACSHTLAQRWGMPLREHPQAGHDLPLDDAAWVIARVREWQRSSFSARGG